ncbi:MAG: hypothetical protein K4571_02610 [Deltaproteobacteria bacterium]
MTKWKIIFKRVFTIIACLWLLLLGIILPRAIHLFATIYDNFDLTKSHFIDAAHDHASISHGIYFFTAVLIIVCLIVVHKRSKNLWPSVTVNSVAIFASILYLIISTAILFLPLMEHAIIVKEKYKSEQGNTADR